MDIYIAWGINETGQWTIIGASKSQEGIDKLTINYKKDNMGLHPYVSVRLFELKD